MTEHAVCTEVHRLKKIDISLELQSRSSSHVVQSQIKWPCSQTGRMCGFRRGEPRREGGKMRTVAGARARRTGRRLAMDEEDTSEVNGAQMRARRTQGSRIWTGFMGTWSLREDEAEDIRAAGGQGRGQRERACSAAQRCSCSCQRFSLM